MLRRSTPVESVGKDKLARRLQFYKALLLAACILVPKIAKPQMMSQPLVRIAELEIEPAQVDAYTALLKEEISSSVRLESGVLTLYAVSLKGHPNQIRILEMYADQTAYEAHLQTPHFKKYKAETQGMVKALKLIETDPILLGAKPVDRK